MNNDDAQQVAQAVAKGVNLGIQAHETAFHGPETQVTASPATPRAPLGLLRDPAGDWSSKRTESLIALAFGILWPIVAAELVKLGLDVTKVIDSNVFTGALLGYSAAMQGISWAAERGMQ